MPSSAPLAPALLSKRDTKNLADPKQRSNRKKESKLRAELGQAAIERGEEPPPIDPKEAARYQALAEGRSETRQTLGFSLEDNVRRIKEELAKHQPAPVTEETAAPAVKEKKRKKTAAPVVGDVPAETSVTDASRIANPTVGDTSDEDEDEDEDEDDDEDDDAIKHYGRYILEEDEEEDMPEYDLESKDEKEEGVVVDATSGKTHKPICKFIKKYSKKIFGTQGYTSLPSLDTKDRCDRFDGYVRTIIQRLKLVAGKYVKTLLTREFRAMTRRYVIIFHNSDEEWLVQQVLKGIPESTKLVLGKKDLTIDDLLSLPRLMDEELLEQGIYIDVVQDLGASPEQLFELYIGSASGENGISQRWYDYEPASRCPGGSRATGIHGTAINDPNKTMNLRALAIYGNDPIAWLTILSESIFMILLGTVEDTGIRWTGRNADMVSDEMYGFFAEISKDFPVSLGKGLNSTLSIKQGYRMRYNSPRAKCCNPECGRPVVPKKDPAYQKHRFAYYDACRPGEAIICLNCLKYEKENEGAQRPGIYERKRVFRDNNPRSLCMWKDCNKELKYVPKEDRKGEDPGTLVQDPDSTSETFIWVCEPHAKTVRYQLKQTRARNDVDGTAPVIPKKNPRKKATASKKKDDGEGGAAAATPKKTPRKRAGSPAVTPKPDDEYNWVSLNSADPYFSRGSHLLPVPRRPHWGGHVFRSVKRRRFAYDPDSLTE
ncbi:hypothetical protein CUC08_Gglean008136 [Alternaria sp. MG1]|nr:hypothetical protein CUC08_Gglean008136 [Alternaria sp. MG1]